MGHDVNLLVVKVNSTLNNSENKIHSKFFEALGLQNLDKGQQQAEEMYAKVREYFS